MGEKLISSAHNVFGTVFLAFLFFSSFFIYELSPFMENFDEHVQMMLRSLSGMNYSDLEKMLNFIIHARITKHDKNEENPADILDRIKISQDFLPGCRLHDSFDIVQARAALKSIRIKKCL